MNIPKRITDKFSGLGQLMLDDGLAFFNGNKKFNGVDGTMDLYMKSSNYADYGGQSILLTKFWKAVEELKQTKNPTNKFELYKEAAFSIFSGDWAKNNGFTGFRIDDIGENIGKEEVIFQFLKK